MKKLLINVILAFGITLSVGSAQAITVGFEPVVGAPAAVDLTISGLGDFGPPSLAGFDLDVMFDSSILGFSSVMFGTFLGDETLVEADTRFDGSTPGVLNLSEVSLLSDLELDLLQPEAFILATLTFDTLGVGTSMLDIANLALVGASAGELQATIESGRITAVPVLGTLILFSSGLIALVGLGRIGRRA